MEVPIVIGTPPKPHKFDFASKCGRFVGESKCYTWTETGNVPSGVIQENCQRSSLVFKVVAIWGSGKDGVDPIPTGTNRNRWSLRRNTQGRESEQCQRTQ